mmetsp:Transcript_54425/g.167551  ORF Transcript_54425/g.167551 Transcript_54425/m.167551 type:complete len:263 (-) Transcript_54425:1306-2094(-)
MSIWATTRSMYWLRFRMPDELAKSYSGNFNSFGARAFHVATVSATRCSTKAVENVPLLEQDTRKWTKAESSPAPVRFCARSALSVDSAKPTAVSRVLEMTSANSALTPIEMHTPVVPTMANQNAEFSVDARRRRTPTSSAADVTKYRCRTTKSDAATMRSPARTSSSPMSVHSRMPLEVPSMSPSNSKAEAGTVEACVVEMRNRTSKMTATASLISVRTCAMMTPTRVAKPKLSLRYETQDMESANRIAPATTVEASCNDRC